MHVEYLERPRASTRRGHGGGARTRRTDLRYRFIPAVRGRALRTPCSASIRPCACRPRPECRKYNVNVRTTVQGSLVLHVVQFRTRTGYRVRRVTCNALAARE